MLNIITTGISVIRNESNIDCLLCGWKKDAILFHLTLISLDCNQIYTIDICRNCCYELYDELAAAIEMYQDFNQEDIV